MGSGASNNPAVGVPANPRVVYNDQLSRKENKRTVIDAPVLVDVQHGSVRYRYSQPGEGDNKSRGVERPYEGTDTRLKQNYFYHARLKDFSSGCDPSKEDSFKFLYVTKGPARAQQKKLFYVYGRGLDAEDGTRVKPTETKEERNDYSWPGLRVPNHLYYMLVFDASSSPAVTEDVAAEELQSTPDKSSMRFTLPKETRARELKGKVAVKILKAASDIHLCTGNIELREEDMVGEYQEEAHRDREQFDVELRLI